MLFQGSDLVYMAHLEQEQLEQGTTWLNSVLNETVLVWHNCTDTPASRYRQNVHFSHDPTILDLIAKASYYIESVKNVQKQHKI